MREEVEAAVTFLTRLLAKKVICDPGGGGGGGGGSGGHVSSRDTNGSITNHNSSIRESATSVTSNRNDNNHFNHHNHHNHLNPHPTLTDDKIKKFSQKLIDVLMQRYQNHWYPGHPSKGQAYRCIRINQNCRVDYSIELACQHAGITYESLRLPVELTLWIDPSEVTCRFGEHKGSFCIVAKLGDGRQENFADSINIDELEARSIDRSKQSFDPRLKMKPHVVASVQQRQMAAMSGHGHHVVSSATKRGNQQASMVQAQQSPISMNPFSPANAASLAANPNINSNNVYHHAMNGGAGANGVGLPNGSLAGQPPSNHHGLTSHHGSPVGGGAANTLTNGFGVDYGVAAINATAAAASNAAFTSGSGIFGATSGGGAGAGTGGAGSASGFQPGTNGGSSAYQAQYTAPYFNAFHQLPQQAVAAAAAVAAANFQHSHQSPQVVTAVTMQQTWSTGGHGIFASSTANKFMSGLSGSPQQPNTSSTPPSTSSVGQLANQSSSGRNSLSNHLPSALNTTTGGGFRSNNSLTSSVSTVPSLATSISTSQKSQQNSQLTTQILTNGSGLTNNSTTTNSTNGNSTNTTSNGGANPNAPHFIPRGAGAGAGGYLSSSSSSFNLSAQPFTPSASVASLSNNFQIDTSTSNNSSSTKDRRTFTSSTSPGSAAAAAAASSVVASGATPTATAGTPLVANNRF